jgi:quinol monooxygenase YgiN
MFYGQGLPAHKTSLTPFIEKISIHILCLQRKKGINMSQIPVFLLSIRGALAPHTLEAARSVHNQTAGVPANVAAAKSLGDLSHMVYVPVGQSGPNSGEFLILDQWNSIEGLNQFFANEHVQAQAAEIFSQRDPVVWAPAEDFYSYHFPAPYGKNERYIGIVRGMLPSRAAAREVHNALVGKSVNQARAAGDMSHEAFFRLTPPGAPESLEWFAVDVWHDAAGMAAYYNNPAFMSALMGMFSAPPDASVWSHPAGEWVEW